MKVHVLWTLDALVASFVRHQQRTRGTGAHTLRGHDRHVREFVRAALGDDPVDPSLIGAPDVVSFISAHAAQYRPRTVKEMATSLRWFFRYLRFKSIHDGRLAAPKTCGPVRRHCRSRATRFRREGAGAPKCQEVASSSWHHRSAMSIAARVRRRVERARVGEFVRASEFAGLSRSAVDSALSRLARGRGDLVRLRKGLYWKGVRSRFGAGRPGALATALAVAGPGSGPSGISAASALGLTTRRAAVPTVAVIGRAPTGLHGVRFVSRSNLERRTLRPIEVALLEVLREFLLHEEGAWDDLIARVRVEVDRGRIRLGTVVRAAMSEHGPATRTRATALQEALVHGHERARRFATTTRTHTADARRADVAVETRRQSSINRSRGR